MSRRADDGSVLEHLEHGNTSRDRSAVYRTCWPGCTNGASRLIATDPASISQPSLPVFASRYLEGPSVGAPRPHGISPPACSIAVYNTGLVAVSSFRGGFMVPNPLAGPATVCRRPEEGRPWCAVAFLGKPKFPRKKHDPLSIRGESRPLGHADHTDNQPGRTRRTKETDGRLYGQFAADYR